MTLFRLLAAALSVTLLSSCQTAGALAQEPMTLVNDIFTSVGRVFHSSANDREPGDNSIEAKEVQKAQVALQNEQSAQPASVNAEAASTVAAR